MQSISVFLFLLALRVASVFLVRTWYVPDEYWQSLEVGHHLAFGYGHLTWEWAEGIRSYLHPLLIAGVYRVLLWLQLDTVQWLILVPRVMQALLSAVADYRFFAWSNHSKWSVFMIATAWFWFYTGSRTLSNTVEASLTTIALSWYPWKSESTSFIWLVGLVSFIRPTAAIPWLPLCLRHIRSSKFTVIELLLKRYLLIGLFLGAALVSLDSYAHGSLIFTPIEFLRVNVLNEIGSFYGTHPWHWYFTIGLPTVLGIATIPFLFAASETLRNPLVYPERFSLLISIFFTLVVYSLLPHKEFRFVLPLLPMCLFISADYLSRWSRKSSGWFVWLVALVLLAGNVVPAAYLSFLHQRGTIEVMPQLAELARDYRGQDGQNAKFLFLMPCHSTPYFSHIHHNTTMRFLTCEPNLKGVDNYVDEADKFYSEPAAWIRSHLPVHPKSALPTHVILFDSLVDKIAAFLNGFRKVYEFEHTQFPSERVGKNVVIYERIIEEPQSAE